MKYFKATLVQNDGEHEHHCTFVAKGRSEDTVRTRIEREQLYDIGDKSHPNCMLDYGDDTTAVGKYWLEAIPAEHYTFLLDNKYMQEI